MLIHKYINYYANVFVLLSIDASPYRFFLEKLEKKFIFLYYGFFGGVLHRWSVVRLVTRAICQLVYRWRKMRCSSGHVHNRYHDDADIDG